MTLSSARLESLKTSATERMDVNQIFGSPGPGLYSPLAMAIARERIASCDITPITIVFKSISLGSAGDDSVNLAKEVHQQLRCGFKWVRHADVMRS